MSVLGLRLYFRTLGRGTLHCQRCGGDRGYRRCTGRRWIHVLNIPVIPLEHIAEHVDAALDAVGEPALLHKFLAQEAVVAFD